ncbi:MAG: hypothetical protein ACI9ZM_003888 [Paracoccaceae bacterium]|jgi:hypothetical protein
MDVEILRQLDQGLLALDRGYSDLSLEGRARGSGAVVSSWSSPRSQQSCRRGAENPLILAVQFFRTTSVCHKYYNLIVIFWAKIPIICRFLIIYDRR